MIPCVASVWTLPIERGRFAPRPLRDHVSVLAPELAARSGTNLGAGIPVRTETFSPRGHRRFPPRSQAAPCSCCGAPQERLVGPSPFCAECLERAKAHDTSDPYDELGEGD